MAKRRWGWTSGVCWIALLLLAGCGGGSSTPGPANTTAATTPYPLYGHAADFAWIAGQVVVNIDSGTLPPGTGIALFRYAKDGQEIVLRSPDQGDIRFENWPPKLGAYVVLFGHIGKPGEPCGVRDINQTPCYFPVRIGENPQFPGTLATPTPDPRLSMPPPTPTPPVPTPTRDPSLPAPGPTINLPVLTAQVVPLIRTVPPTPLPSATPLPSPPPFMADDSNVLAINLWAVYRDNHRIMLKVGQTLQLDYTPEAYGILLDWTMQLTTPGHLRLMKTDTQGGNAGWTYRAMQPGQTILRMTTDAVCHQAPQPCGGDPKTFEFAITVR